MPELQIAVPPHIAETIQAIALLHAEHHRKSTLAERIVDKATTFIARPRFLLALIMAAAFWMAANVLIRLGGGSPLDPPPFVWLELVLSASALVIAVMILTSQTRADRFANLREQMTLEATLLTEQKTRKIIELLEELRRDSPEIPDREDLEADQMAAKADPHEMSSVIEDITREAAIAIIQESQ
jgi:uncharacterized membrane protein